MKVEVNIFKILLCFSLLTSIVDAQITTEQLNAFRSAKRIKIILNQSLDETIDNNISFIDVTKRLLEEYIKCEIVRSNENKFDLILDIVVKGKGIKTKSGSKTIELSGNISLKVPDKSIYKKSFYGIGFWSDGLKGAFTNTGSFLNTMLEIIGEVWGSEPIISCLKDEDIYVMMRATDVLGKMKDPNTVQPLIDAFKKTKKYDKHGHRYSKEYLQSFMISALGEIGDERAVPYFMSYFKNCRGSKLAAKAVEALGKSTALWTIRPLLYATELWGVGGTVKEELLQIGKPAVDTLISVLQKEKISTSQRDLIISVLSDIGDPKAVEPIVNILNDSRTGFKSHIISALGKIGDSSAVESIINQFEEFGGYDQNSRNPAIFSALVKIGSWKAIEFLFSTYKNLPVLNKNDAYDDLKNITNPNGIKNIISLLMDHKYTDRVFVARILGDLKDTTSVKPLYTVFSDEGSPFVIRIEAYNSLIKKIDNNMVLNHILTVLENTKQDSMKLYLISELGRIKDSRAINPLYSLFNDKKSSLTIRLEAAKSIVKLDSRKISDPDIIDPLIKIALVKFKNKQYDIYKQVVSAFKDMSSKTANDLRDRLPKVTIKGQIIYRENKKPLKNTYIFFIEITKNNKFTFYEDLIAKTDTNGFFILNKVPTLVGDYTLATSKNVKDILTLFKVLSRKSLDKNSILSTNYGRLKEGYSSISYTDMDESLTFSIIDYDLLKFEISIRKQTELKFEF